MNKGTMTAGVVILALLSWSPAGQGQITPALRAVIDAQKPPPGTMLEYETPDWYDRPWAKIWEDYFAEGMQRPEDEMDIFEFE